MKMRSKTARTKDEQTKKEREEEKSEIRQVHEKLQRWIELQTSIDDDVKSTNATPQKTESAIEGTTVMAAQSGYHSDAERRNG